MAFKITKKQAQVYELRRSGMTYREIGDILGMSAHSARSHMEAATLNHYHIMKHEERSIRMAGFFEGSFFNLNKGEARYLIEVLKRF